MGNKKQVWLIAYVNRKHIEVVQSELIEYGYKEVEAYIPTIKVLRKKFKGKNCFEFIPLLFNYGFFKVPYESACNSEYLSELRQRITCIYGWVKDPIKEMQKDRHLKASNTNLSNAIPRAAVATDKEIQEMVKTSGDMGIYTQEDLKRIGPGDYIKLEGYPFEGMPAEVVSINHKKGEVSVKLLIDSFITGKEIKVSFDNVFYTVYKDYRENGRESSSDELNERYGANTIDYIINKRSMQHGE